MQRVQRITVLLAMLLVLSVSVSCKKKAEVKKEPEKKVETVAKKPTVPMADFVKYFPKLQAPLTFDKYSTTGTFLHIYVSNTKTKQKVLWFQVFDQRNDESTLKGYQSATFKVGKYPAKKMDNNWVWVLVNNIEIRLVADSKNKEYQNTAKLVKFLESFDLAGLEKL